MRSLRGLSICGVRRFEYTGWNQNLKHKADNIEQRMKKKGGRKEALTFF